MPATAMLMVPGRYLNPPRRHSRLATPQMPSSGWRRRNGVGSMRTPEWRSTFHSR